MSVPNRIKASTSRRKTSGRQTDAEGSDLSEVLIASGREDKVGISRSRMPGWRQERKQEQEQEEEQRKSSYHQADVDGLRSALSGRRLSVCVKPTRSGLVPGTCQAQPPSFWSHNNHISNLDYFIQQCDNSCGCISKIHPSIC